MLWKEKWSWAHLLFFALYNNPCLKCSMHRVEGKSVCSATAVLAPLPGWKVTKPTACGTLAAAPLAAGTNRGPQTKGCHPHIPFKNWRCVPGIRCSGDCSCLAFCECFRILQHIRWWITQLQCHPSIDWSRPHTRHSRVGRWFLFSIEAQWTPYDAKRCLCYLWDASHHEVASNKRNNCCE